jgi:hypothetical protein
MSRCKEEKENGRTDVSRVMEAAELLLCRLFRRYDCRSCSLSLSRLVLTVVEESARRNERINEGRPSFVRWKVVRCVE